VIHSLRPSLRTSGIASVAIAGLAIATLPAATTYAATATAAHPAAQSAEPMVPGTIAVHTRADASGTTTTSENWFGYGAHSGTYTSVESTWVQPSVDCSKGAGEAVFWVGLDGWSSSTVEQTGTQAYCSIFSDTPTYYAWWETYPSNGIQDYGDTVKAGDTVTAKVVYQGSDKYELYLTDKTQGWTEDNVENGPSGAENSSAEVVGETPEINILGATFYYNLPDFGTVDFTDSEVDGAPIGDTDPTALDLAREGDTLATTGPLSNGTDFAETWDAHS
jgi:hypothetical protein